ncbi:probable protein S-acyltransferase 1 [Salvia miltiorrhiza]|uniref:probable protein S-acyltransferase 1 n=1 Tax=Salvia miltiorrhiza TaxID=226208 RepID=UPI0025AB96B9|nr:probable protein S-acyltransferase 1 [Salvia miltiorrhiza]XP_057767392.1 probable protein S-acyltransferase 1 [Salvia miltiorrhiza]
MGNQDFVAAPPKWMDPPTVTKKRLYQVWKGRNNFLCGGRLILGPDTRSALLTTLMIGGPALAFCIKMYLRISTAGDVSWGHAVSIVGLVLTLLDLSFLFMTSMRNPGIIPRNTKPPVLDNVSLDSFPSIEWIAGVNPEVKPPRTKDVVVNGYVVKVKYCDTCLLYRPPRASHCSTCNNCIQRFDHHCPWLNQCIGARNYATFILFITTSTILCVYVFTFSLVNLLKESGWAWRVLSDDMMLVSLIIYSFIAVWFVGGLSVFHYYLIFTNQTTYENFRSIYGKRENPYNLGVMKNLKEILCSKTAPSLVNFREWVSEEEARFAESITKRYGGDINRKGDMELNFYGKDGKPLPQFVQDYDRFEESLKEGRGGKSATDPFFLPFDEDQRNETHDHAHASDDDSSRSSSMAVSPR